MPRRLRRAELCRAADAAGRAAAAALAVALAAVAVVAAVAAARAAVAAAGAARRRVPSVPPSPPGGPRSPPPSPPSPPPPPPPSPPPSVCVDARAGKPTGCGDCIGCGLLWCGLSGGCVESSMECADAWAGSCPDGDAAYEACYTPLAQKRCGACTAASALCSWCAADASNSLRGGVDAGCVFAGVAAAQTLACPTLLAQGECLSAECVVGDACEEGRPTTRPCSRSRSPSPSSSRCAA